MLTVVHLRAGAVAGARRDREGQIAEPQQVVVDGEVGHIVVRTQHRQHNSAVASSSQSMSKNDAYGR